MTFDHLPFEYAVPYRLRNLDYGEISDIERDLKPVSRKVLCDTERFNRLEDDDDIVSFDNGATYYWMEDIDKWLEEAEKESREEEQYWSDESRRLP